MHALMTGEGSRINLGIHSNTRQEYVLPCAKSVEQPSVCTHMVSSEQVGFLEILQKPLQTEIKLLITFKNSKGDVP